MSDTLYWNDDGIKNCLDLFAYGAGTNYLAPGRVRLFKNNVTCSKATTLGALTESAYPGYGAILVSTEPFSPSTVSGHVATASTPFYYDFLCSGGGTMESAYGGYVTDVGGTRLLCCWNFATGPFVMFAPGDEIRVTLIATSESKN